jgi:two-component system OmpR family response regulator
MILQEEAMTDSTITDGRRDQRRALIVDDNRDTAVSLALVFEHAGYDVETALSGDAAVDAVERFCPEVCILDINMPGMDGYELAHRIRALTSARHPVLATLTGYSDDQHLDRAVDAGFDLHFTKPGEASDILDQVGDMLQRQRFDQSAEVVEEERCSEALI